MIGTEFITPYGHIWTITNILDDGQIVCTSDDDRYVVVKDTNHCEILFNGGYGDPVTDPVPEGER